MSLPRLWTRHLVNSAAVVPFVPPDSTVADIGSGAGFPGIVLAAMRPDVTVDLVEPMERRVTWLADVVEEVGLDNVRLVRARAEEPARPGVLRRRHRPRCRRAGQGWRG